MVFLSGLSMFMSGVLKNHEINHDIVLAGFMQQPTSDAHSSTYLISANFDGISCDLSMWNPSTVYPLLKLFYVEDPAIGGTVEAYPMKNPENSWELPKHERHGKSTTKRWIICWGFPMYVSLPWVNPHFFWGVLSLPIFAARNTWPWPSSTVKRHL